MDIGKSIKIACVENDVKQRELAETLGVTPITISKLANNRGGCKKSTLEALANAFDMPVSEFIALGE